ADGIVGKVLHADRHVAEVLLIDDQTSGVGAILDKSRLQGILRGTPSGELMLEKVMSDETVPTGELVLTSGGDRIFPKGLTVGRVTKVSPGSEVFLNIRVHPAAELNRLEEVLVVTKIDERQAEPDQTGATRAIDILAERLPTVPPKPDDATKGAAGTAAPGTVPPGSTKPTTVKPAAVAPGTAKPTTVVPTTTAPATAGSDAKLKTVPPPAAATAAAPAPRKPATAASATGTSAGTGSSLSPATPAKVTGNPATKPAPKPVKTDVPSQPKPQPAVEDTPH